MMGAAPDITSRPENAQSLKRGHLFLWHALSQGQNASQDPWQASEYVSLAESESHAHLDRLRWRQPHYLWQYYLREGFPV